MKKRYAVFAGLRYYPKGGWDDLQQIFVTLTEARAQVDYIRGEREQYYDWYQVVDLETQEIVSSSSVS